MGLTADIPVVWACMWLDRLISDRFVRHLAGIHFDRCFDNYFDSCHFDTMLGIRPIADTMAGKMTGMSIDMQADTIDRMVGIVGAIVPDLVISLVAVAVALDDTPLDCSRAVTDTTVIRMGISMHFDKFVVGSLADMMTNMLAESRIGMPVEIVLTFVELAHAE